MTIRTTWNNTFAQLSQRTLSLSSEVAKMQERAITGLSYTRPSDNPSLVARVHDLSARVRDQQAFQETATRTTSTLDTADATVGSMADVLVRAREMAVQFSSETYTDADRQAGAAEASALFEQMVSLANTEVGGRHLFSGTATGTPPFTADGVYQGSDEEASARVGEGNEVTTGFVGRDLFQGDTDVFGALRDLRDALSSGQADAVQAVTTTLADATGALGQARTRVGIEESSALDATDLAENLETQFSSDLSDATSADQVETITRLSELQSTYQGALQVLATLKGRNLFESM